MIAQEYVKENGLAMSISVLNLARLSSFLTLVENELVRFETNEVLSKLNVSDVPRHKLDTEDVNEMEQRLSRLITTQGEEIATAIEVISKRCLNEAYVVDAATIHAFEFLTKISLKIFPLVNEQVVE